MFCSLIKIHLCRSYITIELLLGFQFQIACHCHAHTFICKSLKELLQPSTIPQSGDNLESDKHKTIRLIGFRNICIDLVEDGLVDLWALHVHLSGLVLVVVDVLVEEVGATHVKLHVCLL